MKEFVNDGISLHTLIRHEMYASWAQNEAVKTIADILSYLTNTKTDHGTVTHPADTKLICVHLESGFWPPDNESIIHSSRFFFFSPPGLEGNIKNITVCLAFRW